MNNLDPIVLFKNYRVPLPAAYHFAIAFNGEPIRLQTKMCYQPLYGYRIRNVATLSVDIDLQTRLPAFFNPAE
jgi:hypothetical protein